MLPGDDAHASADSAAIRLGSGALDLQPVVLARTVIAQQCRRFIHVDHYNVNISVIIKVSKRRSTARAGFVENGTAVRSDIGKVAISQVTVENLPLFESEMQLLGVHLREYVATRNEYVGPPVVVKIAQPHAPAQIFRVDSQTSLQNSIVEGAVSIIVVEARGLIGIVGLHDVEPAIAIVIAD